MPLEVVRRSDPRMTPWCRIEAKFGQTMEKAIYHKMGLHSKASIIAKPNMSPRNALAEQHFHLGSFVLQVDSYTGDFFFIFRVASLIKAPPG